MELSAMTDSGTHFLYKESFWTGKKSLAVDGVPAVKMAKRTFQVEREVKREAEPIADANVAQNADNTADEASVGLKPETPTPAVETVNYLVKGNFVTGVTIVSSKKETIVLAKNKWYDWIMIFLPILGMAVGVALCGAIGGALSALFTFSGAIINAIISRSKIPLGGKIPLQLLVTVGVNAIWFACWYVIAVVILSMTIAFL